MRFKGFLLPILDMALMMLLMGLTLYYLAPQPPLLEEEQLKLGFKACKKLYDTLYTGGIAELLWSSNRLTVKDTLLEVVLNEEIIYRSGRWVHPLFHASYSISAFTREGELTISVKVGPS